MSKSRWSQWVIAESATTRIPLPWDRKTRIRHRQGYGVGGMIHARPVASAPGATA